ncbi:MAG: hypothetical protein OXC55_00900 [Chloroflexi bacterium]|nr:hypothetical protein [Chloroflexota bacterium]
MTNEETWALERAVRLCREAPLSEKGNVSYERSDILREINALMEGMNSLCRVANKLLDESESSERHLTFREEILIAVLFKATMELGFEALLLDNDKGSGNVIELLGLIDLGASGALSPLYWIDLPKDILLVDVAANLLTEHVSHVRTERKPEDNDPDPLDVEGMRAFAKQILEPHFWPVRQARLTSSEVAPKSALNRQIMRLRWPNKGEIWSFAIPASLIALLMAVFTEPISIFWLAVLSVGAGSIGAWSRVAVDRERDQEKHKEFEFKRQKMFVRESVMESVYDFNDRFMKAVRAGPRGFY